MAEAAKRTTAAQAKVAVAAKTQQESGDRVDAAVATVTLSPISVEPDAASVISTTGGN